jgi:60 kDa SS-A/Ro ribonucleoprotein
VPLAISPRQRLDDVVSTVSGIPFGGTDCAPPMVWATQHKAKVDVFVVYTDSETWYSREIHPMQALRQYREKMGIRATLMVVGMTSNGFSIADPDDAGALDSAVPSVMADFVRA